MTRPELPPIVVVVGCGPSIERFCLPEHRPPNLRVVACNRAIELVAADWWVTVDRVHYERSKAHSNARRASRVFVGTVKHELEAELFAPTDVLPGGDGQLFLAGGTLTAAAHFAVGHGAQTVVFVGCDAWDESRDRYHAWDGAPLNAAGRELHRDHLARTAGSIRRLAEFYSDVKFYDATDGPRHLGLPTVTLPGATHDAPRVIARDVAVPRGYGRLVTVTLDGRDALLWFEDTNGDVRVVRADRAPDGGLPFITRT